MVDVGSLSSVGGLVHEVHPRSAQNRHPATWCTPFISPSLMCRQGQGVVWQIGRYWFQDWKMIGMPECQTEKMIGYWNDILDVFIGIYIGMIYRNDILDMVWWWMYVQLGPQEDPPEKCGLETLVKSRRSARVTLAGYEDINQEWSPIFFRHTWSYSHKPVLFGSFSCVIERC